MKKRHRKFVIRGIEIALNILYWKCPEDYSSKMIADINNFCPIMEGYFYFDDDKEKIKFKKLPR